MNRAVQRPDSVLLTPGLVSVSFRALSPDEIVALCRETGLTAIEWGGDVHVPPGDGVTARRVRGLTEAAGLSTVCYGSYYRLGDPPDADAPPFEAVLAVAQELHAPTIRVWAGRKGSADSDPDDRRRIVDDALRVADMAAAAGCDIALEYHARTLTDTRTSVRRLLEALPHPAIGTLWQPSTAYSFDERIASLDEVLPRLRHVHVYHWGDGVRLPLADGVKPWSRYLRMMADAATPRPLPLLLEFVRDNEPDQLRKDAATLHDWIRAIS